MELLLIMATLNFEVVSCRLLLAAYRTTQYTVLTKK